LPSLNSILRTRKEPFYQSIGEKSYNAAPFILFCVIFLTRNRTSPRPSGGGAAHCSRRTRASKYKQKFYRSNQKWTNQILI